MPITSTSTAGKSNSAYSIMAPRPSDAVIGIVQDGRKRVFTPV
jgi:hypothetical protein